MEVVEQMDSSEALRRHPHGHSRSRSRSKSKSEDSYGNEEMVHRQSKSSSSSHSFSVSSDEDDEDGDDDLLSNDFDQPGAGPSRYSSRKNSRSRSSRSNNRRQSTSQYENNNLPMQAMKSKRRSAQLGLSDKDIYRNDDMKLWVYVRRFEEKFSL